jgi:hypothetical protein
MRPALPAKQSRPAIVASVKPSLINTAASFRFAADLQIRQAGPGMMHLVNFSFPNMHTMDVMNKFRRGK